MGTKSVPVIFLSSPFLKRQPISNSKRGTPCRGDEAADHVKRNARCETAAVCRTLNTLGWSWSWTCTFFFYMLIPTALGNIVIVEIMIILSSHALNTPCALGPLGPSTMVFIWSLWRLCVDDIKRWSPRVPIYGLYILWWTNIHIYIYGSYRLFIVSHMFFRD